MNLQTNFTHLAKFAVAAAIMSIPAVAIAAPITGQISINGYAEAVGGVGFGAATGIDFANGSGTSISGTSGVLTSFGAGTGSFAGLFCSSGSCGTIKDIASFATSAPISSFLTLNTGGPAVTFDLTSITNVTNNTATDSLSFMASGTINFSGYNSTPGTFTLTAQGDNITSFSATALAGSAAPEPSTWAMITLGCAGLGVQTYRRKAKVFSPAA